MNWNLIEQANNLDPIAWDQTIRQFWDVHKVSGIEVDWNSLAQDFIQNQGENKMITAGLNSLTFDKEAVLERLIKNEQTHRLVFEEAMEGFRAEIIRQLEQRLAHARKGNPISLHFQIDEPQDHTDDYRNIIEMLELTNENTIVLSMGEYKCYMRDEWPWRNQFLTTANNYGSVTAAAAYK